MKDEKPIVTYNKNAEKNKNRVIIPKFFIDKNGREFYMQVFEDYIKIIPVKKGE